MKKLVVALVILCVPKSRLVAQMEISIADELKYETIFSYEKSGMLDTSSVQFKKAKKNVLKYCNKHLNFKVDSIATLYSCRYFIKNNPNNTPEENEYIAAKGISHKFFLSFKVNNYINYHLHFYLDSSMNVKAASETLFHIKKPNLWSIPRWETIKEKAEAYDNGWIKPIRTVDIEYSEHYGKFIYKILQDITNYESGERNIGGFTYGEYELRVLYVNPETGEVLDKTVNTVKFVNGNSF